MYFYTVFLVLVTVSQANELYLNEWSVHIPAGKEAADRFAADNGLVNLGEIIPGSNEFHMKHPKRSKRSVEQDHRINQRITDHHEVRAAEQLVEKVRVKRDLDYQHRLLPITQPDSVIALRSL